MHMFQNFRPLVTRVTLIVTTGVVTLFSGASWEIDAPVDMSSRTKTSMVAGSGTAGQAGIAPYSSAMHLEASSLRTKST